MDTDNEDPAGININPVAGLKQKHKAADVNAQIEPESTSTQSRD